MPHYTLDDHWLNGVTRRLSPNTSRLVDGPEAVIIHYTAGQSASGAIAHLCNPETKVSAHLVIAGDGSITQLLPFNRQAWHAGESSLGGRPHVNDFSVGIELVNPGPIIMGSHLPKDLNGAIWRGGVIRAKHARADVTFEHWATYSSEQLAATFDAFACLNANYPIKHVAGHSDVTSRKLDPGPAFPMDTFRFLLRHQSPGRGIT